MPTKKTPSNPTPKNGKATLGGRSNHEIRQLLDRLKKESVPKMSEAIAEPISRLEYCLAALYIEMVALRNRVKVLEAEKKKPRR